MQETVIGIDVGGTKIAGALITMEGVILRRLKTHTNQTSAAMILEQIAAFIDDLLAYSKGKYRVMGVGVGAPGTIDRENGVAMTATNLPWQNTPIGPYLEGRFALPVFLENDVNAAALGEYVFGVAKHVRTFAFVSLGTGIGGGIMIDGQLLRGQGQAEIGHIVVGRDRVRCSCGDFDCIETIASGPAIAKSYQDLLVQQGERLNDTIDGKYVLRAAAHGVESALTVVQNAVRALVRGIIAIERIICPELVVLGGGMMWASNLLLPLIKEELNAAGSAAAAIGDRVVASGLIDAVECGAAVLPMEKLKKGGLTTFSGGVTP